jgi:hypothetical protein
MLFFCATTFLVRSEESIIIAAFERFCSTQSWVVRGRKKRRGLDTTPPKQVRIDNNNNNNNNSKPFRQNKNNKNKNNETPRNSSSRGLDSVVWIFVSGICL